MEGVIYYQNFDWGEEITNSIKVWISVVLSLCYCYFTSKIVPKGKIRLCLFIPIVYLFLILPLHIHSMHIGGLSSFFIAWLANFKILLFAFGKGPLSDPSLALSHFIAIGCFPIKIQENRLHKNIKSSITPSWSYWLKGALVPVFLKIYDCGDWVHPKVILIIYCFHIYISLDITLAVMATLARVTLGLELEPQFKAPFMSTSLQDFWGKRWNLMVTRILRISVYDPAIKIWARALGRKWAPIPAVLSTFLVSALMHELIFFYLGRTWPTWEITWFFLLHGMSLALEVLIKKAVGPNRCQMPRVVSTPLTFGFVMVTGFWLFFPPLLRCKADVKAFEEYAILGKYVKELVVDGAVQIGSFNTTRAPSEQSILGVNIINVSFFQRKENTSSKDEYH